MLKLGQKVKDIITGFEGIAVSRVEYLTGCAQIGVTPSVGNDGKIPDTQYFDHTRLVVLTKESVMESVNQDRGGPNRDCPK